MYICHDCGYKFESSLKIKEKHNLCSSPFEIIPVCPRCKSSNYEKEELKFCHCCGARLKENQTDYCSEACKKRRERLWQRELSRKRHLSENPIYEFVKEVEKYNHLNHTRLSYGQFAALVKSQNRSRRKNGKKQKRFS